jgi:hypothetical protein
MFVMMIKSISKPFLISSLAIILLFTGILQSCTKEDSSDVNQDKIYAEYELFYDENTDKTYAACVFRFSNAFGTNLELSAPSEVKFGNDLLTFDPVLSYYRKEYAGLITSGTFTFADTLGSTYQNTITLPSPISNPNIDTIKRSLGSFTYAWVGSANPADSWTSVSINNTLNWANFQYFLQNNLGAENMVFGINQLNQLPIGPAFVQLERVFQKTATNVTSSGGVVRAKYKALNKNIIVE